MAVSRKPRKRVRPTRAETRARLLQAAGEVFTERGYDGATLDDVAAAAGLTKGAVYSSFTGKEELFYALMRERIGERVAMAGQAVERQGTAREMTRDAGSALAALIANESEWHLLFIEFWSRAVRDPALRQEFTRERRSARALIARFLQERAVEAGVELPAEPEQLAIAVLALSNGIAIEHLADPEEVDPSVFAVILSLLLDGLLHASEPDGRSAARQVGR
jgi:AcrR family transcriptional regulator